MLKDIMGQYMCERLVRVVLTSLMGPVFLLNMSSDSNTIPTSNDNHIES